MFHVEHYFLKCSKTISGGLFSRGTSFSPRARPLETTSYLPFASYTPPAYFGNNPWFGAKTPLFIGGKRH